MLHWEGCEVTLLVGTSVCIGWFRSILQEKEMQSVSEKNSICAVKKHSKKTEIVRDTVFPRGLSP